MKLTYKKSFWFLLIFSLILAIYQFGKITSLKVDLAFKNINLSFLKSDAAAISKLTTKRIYSKNVIEDFLNKNYYTSDGVKKRGDTLFLDKSFLLFKNDSLISIIIN